MYETLIELLLLGIALIGLLLTISAFRRFRQVAIDPMGVSLMGTISMLIVGVLMVGFPAAVDMAQHTVFQEQGLSVLAYDPYTTDEVKTLLGPGLSETIPVEVVIFFIQFLKILGLYGMGKGLYLLYEGSVVKERRGRVFFAVVTHLISGAILFNIGYFSCMISEWLSSTMGTQWSFCL